MKYTISKEFHFSAAHHLDELPDDHPCHREHGHNYVVTLVLDSLTLDRAGMVYDYGKLAPFGEFIDAQIDHRDLNVVALPQPTAENLAKFFYENAQGLGLPVVEVEVRETPKTSARYGP